MMRRAFNLYGMPAIFLAVLGWILSSDPPAPIVLGFVTLAFWPLAGIARLEGRREGLDWMRKVMRGDPSPTEPTGRQAQAESFARHNVSTGDPRFD